ncbi:MAG: 3-deoxy-7-phosphoheptulonate synthase class II [Planctomycetota bacterium]|nr:3-deoxy-7-phosphoheptulonate synthase class II [Planctomycetota bacterium]
MPDWSPTSWTSRPATQQPTYPDRAALDEAVAQLATLPPLVTSWEIESLKDQLAEAADGKRFLLQGGDCAESFDDCEPGAIADKLKILLQMSLVLVYGTRKRVIRVGRFAGQYAKPRSEDAETRDGVTLPSYRGDLVNHLPFTEEARRPDPALLVRGYERAAMTLNFIRSLVDGGFADLHHPEYWNLGFVKHSPHAREYQHIVEAIGDSVRFMETISNAPVGQTNRVDFFTSHEGLHLLYEQAQTRQVPRREGWYDLSAHMPWIGMRTCNVDGAHVEFFRGVRNPIGIKIGPPMTPEWLQDLLNILHPDNEPGRLTLIHRFGAHGIAEHLPPLIDTVQKSGKTILWCCDPMHGNTEKTAAGIKTRKFEHILAELEQAFEIHQNMGSCLAGVHFELTGDDVTECTGGARGLTDDDLNRRYRSQVDPRLNYEQALEMAMRITRRVAEMNGEEPGLPRDV